MDALKLAESANVSKTAFLTNMSHDIRTPMNAIIGLTNLMQHDLNNPEKLQAYIDKLHTSSEHLLGLINDVLDMSKIESGAVTLRMDEVNLARLSRLKPSSARRRASAGSTLSSARARFTTRTSSAMRPVCGRCC